MTAANPLVAGPVDVSTPFTGAFLLEDGEALVAAIESGDWVAGGLAAFSAAVDTAAMVSDPLGSLIASGLGWVMEHVEPLRGWMNDLTGDAGEVAGFSQTWSNVATQMTESADELARVVRDLDDMDGDAIRAYLAFQVEAEKHLRAAGSWAEAMAVGMSIASTIVKIVHDIVRDAIAEVVGSVISYAAELVLTAGLATPLVIEQVATRVASLVGRVGKSVTNLLSAGKQLSGLLEKLKALFKRADELFERLLKGGTPSTKPKPNGAPPKPKKGDPIQDPVKRAKLQNDMDSWKGSGGPGYDPTGGQTWDEFLDEYLLGFDPKSGYPVWKWPDEFPNGFDHRGSFTHDLDPGDIIDRIGPDGGKAGQFAAPPDTPFDQKGLPPDRLNPDWKTTQYEVIKELPPSVKVGYTESAFGQPGGGTQYYFPKQIEWYITHGYLKVK